MGSNHPRFANPPGALGHPVNCAPGTTRSPQGSAEARVREQLWAGALRAAGGVGPCCLQDRPGGHSVLSARRVGMVCQEPGRGSAPGYQFPCLLDGAEIAEVGGV